MHLGTASKLQLTDLTFTIFCRYRFWGEFPFEFSDTVVTCENRASAPFPIAHFPCVNKYSSETFSIAPKLQFDIFAMAVGGRFGVVPRLWPLTVAVVVLLLFSIVDGRKSSPLLDDSGSKKLVRASGETLFLYCNNGFLSFSVCVCDNLSLLYNLSCGNIVQGNVLIHFIKQLLYAFIQRIIFSVFSESGNF